jgi:hypothetical protein
MGSRIAAKSAPTPNVKRTEGSVSDGSVSMDSLQRWYTQVCGRNQEIVDAPGKRIVSKYITGKATPAKRL